MSEQVKPRPENKPISEGLTIWFPGFMGTTDSNEGVRQTLERIVQGKVLVSPSEFSSDPVPLGRDFEARSIHQAVQQGSPIQLIAHSMGVGTLVETLNILQKRHPDTFHNPKTKEQIKLVLLAPAGFYPERYPTMHFITAFIELISSQSNVMVKGIARESVEMTLATLIDSFAGFPLSTHEQNASLDRLVKKICPPRSQVDADSRIEQLSFNPENGYRQPPLPIHVERKKNALDALIIQSIEKENRKALITLASQRVQLLFPYTVQAYNGPPNRHMEFESSNVDFKTHYQRNVITFVNALLSLPTMVRILKGDVFRSISEFSDKVDLRFLILGRDPLVPLNEYRRLGFESNVRVIMSGYTHSSWVNGGAQIPGGDMEQALRIALS